MTQTSSTISAKNRDETFVQNLAALTDIIAGSGEQTRGIGFELERILVDRAGTPVPFEGPRGVGALLEALVEIIPGARPVMVEGHLLGLSYEFPSDAGAVSCAISLEPAAQIEISVGPAARVRPLAEAVEAFDRSVEQALKHLEFDAALVAVGYDPFVHAPEDLALIPKERYRAMDAYLSARGAYARDMMRCSASTQVSLDYTSERDAARLCRMTTILGPALAFLFDNAPVFRGMPTPGMARSRIWRAVDAERCGTAPGMLEGFMFEGYASWIASIHPILMTDAAGVTSATNEHAADIMAARPLEKSELMHLLSMVFPNTRLKGFVELREMDALPPRLAAACTSFCQALFYREDLEEALAARFAAVLPHGFTRVDAAAIDAARRDLEDHGWDATPYGIPMTDLADALIELARGALAPSDDADTAFDRTGIEALAQMWDERTLPRDAVAPREIGSRAL